MLSAPSRHIKRLQSTNRNKTRPSVNYRKDWLHHSFLFPGLVWSGKGFHFGFDHLWAVNNHFSVYWAIFGMVTSNKRLNNQPGDLCANLLLTSEKAVFCNKSHKYSCLILFLRYIMQIRTLDWPEKSIGPELLFVQPALFFQRSDSVEI